MLHRVMRLARRLDDAEISLRRTNEAFFHIPGAGCEAVQAALGLLLRPSSDWFVSYYRDRALMLALGMTADEMLLASVGSDEDPGSAGRQIPSNWCSPRLNVASRSSCTGTQFLQAAGLARAGQLLHAQGQSPADQLVYVSAGEGTASQGELWEMLALATRDRLPLFILIQDNGYAISVPSSVQYPGGDIAALLAGYTGLRVESVDGTDPMACLSRLAPVVAHVRSGAGPALVRATVTRPYGHSVSDDQSRYRVDDELLRERADDPLYRFEARLIDAGVLDAEGLARAAAEIDAVVDAAVTRARASRRPDPASACDHLYGRELVAGTPVHATAAELPVGQAYGMAMRGLRPVIELENVDGLWRAMMHLKNELSTLRYRSAGAYACPVVLRVPVGAQDGETLLCKVPGLRVLAPSTLADARGLLAWALRGGDPVIFFEPRGSFPEGWARSVGPHDAVLAPGRLAEVRAGTDVTLVTWGATVAAAVEAAREMARNHGVEVEVVDLRTLAPWDADGVVARVARTGRMLVAEHDVRAHGFGAEVAAEVAERCFAQLTRPVARLGGAPDAARLVQALARLSEVAA